MSQMIICSLQSIVRLMNQSTSINLSIFANNNNNTEKPRLWTIPAIPPEQGDLWFFWPRRRLLRQLGQPDRGPARALGVQLWPLPGVQRQGEHLLQPQAQPGPLPQGQPPAQVLHPVRPRFLLSAKLGWVLVVHARAVLQVGESVHPGRGRVPLPGVVLKNQPKPNQPWQKVRTLDNTIRDGEVEMRYNKSRKHVRPNYVLIIESSF